MTYLTLGFYSSKSRKWAEKAAHPKEGIFSLPTSHVATENNEKELEEIGTRLHEDDWVRAFPRKQDQNIIKRLSLTPGRSPQNVCY